MSNPLLQEKKKKRTADKEMREALGDEAPPKLVPNTTESLRVEDETIVDPEDEEVSYYLKYLGLGAEHSPQWGSGVQSTPPAGPGLGCRALPEVGVWGAEPHPSGVQRQSPWGRWGHLPNLSLTLLKSHCRMKRYAVRLF